MSDKLDYIDVKQTTWDRYYFPTNKYSIEDLKQLIKDDTMFDDIVDIESTGIIEEMTPEENSGNPTEEVFDVNGKMIWDNVNKFNVHG